MPTPDQPSPSIMMNQAREGTVPPAGAVKKGASGGYETSFSGTPIADQEALTPAERECHA